MMAAGVALGVAGVLALRRNLTPLPYPKDDSQRITSGAYSLVRHPIYGGALFAVFGWGLVVRGALTLGYAGLLFLFFELKSRREEGWLCTRFPEYAQYRLRVRKRVPFVW
jgi:protein-S-isoprenylcysteine O-methyltransferase Ste14